MTTAARNAVESAVTSRTLFRSLAIVVVIICPALVLRVLSVQPSPILSLIAYGAAVVAASFVLAWAAEAAQIDVSGSLAVAVLAVIAVLPEYAVDLYYAYTAGHVPEYTQYAAANMTGSNRLLMGIGWPVVVLVSVLVARRANAGNTSGLDLDASSRLEIGFLMIAGVVAFVIPVTGRIHIAFGLALLGWFGYYLFKLTRGDVEEPELVGTAAALGALPDRTRRITVCAMFIFAASVIVTCAKPFADNLIDAGTQLGIDRFLLVQWLAPLASEAPEFIIATIFAARGKGEAAIATLISAKVNQWTLLIGSLPVALHARRRKRVDAPRRPPDRGDRPDRGADGDGRDAVTRPAVPALGRLDTARIVRRAVPDHLDRRTPRPQRRICGDSCRGVGVPPPRGIADIGRAVRRSGQAARWAPAPAAGTGASGVTA